MSVSRQLSDGPAYAGQQRCVLRLEGTPSILPTTVTTGVISSVYTVSSSAITGFATRFGSTFDEYRILKCQFRITAIAAASGLSKFWFDEKSNTAPTLNESFERTSKPMMNTNANMKSQNTTMVWVARDLLDLEYVAIGTATTPAYLKVYTDAANWGAPIVAANVWIIEPIFTIEFRGIKST